MSAPVIPPLTMESDYLVPGVSSSSGGLGYHRVSVTFSPANPAAPGSLHFDPNACGLDDFGDPTMCTLMAMAPWQMGLKLLHEDAGRRVYAIQAQRPGVPPADPVSYSGPPLRLVTLSEQGLPLRGRLLILKADQTIDRIIDLRAPRPHTIQLPFEQRKGLVVLSADIEGGYVPREVRLNHVTRTTIYGDGKVVFVDPSQGDREICEGHLSATEIAGLFNELDQRGFFALQHSYFKPGPTDMATWTITAQRCEQPPMQVASYGGSVSAPPEFMECFEWLTYPKLSPIGVHRYTRQPISEFDLHAGWYYGFEYQKKLNTPQDWVWQDAGKSSRWHRSGLGNAGAGV